MEIVRLPIGKQAPVDTDCIRIEEQSAGSYKLTGSALCTEADDNDSVSLIGTQMFETAEEAEAVGTAWATSIGVDRLFVSTGTLDQPLELMDIDKPL
jgi:hypothetical protein